MGEFLRGIRGQKMNHSNPESKEPGWLSAFICELVRMPRRHIVVFLIITVLLVLLEVEITEGWHLVHIVEVIGCMLFLYLLWAWWWQGRSSVKKSQKTS